MYISTSSCLFSSSTVLAAGLYSKGQSSPLYTVVTIGKAVIVSSSAIGRAVIVKPGLAIGRAVRVN